MDFDEMGQIRNDCIFIIRKIFRKLSGMSKLKNFLVDFDRNFRICQKWANLQLTKHVCISRLLGSVSGEYSSLVICNVLTKKKFQAISEMEQITGCYIYIFLCIRTTGSVSRKYLGFVIQNVQTKKMTGSL